MKTVARQGATQGRFFVLYNIRNYFVIRQKMPKFVFQITIILKTINHV